MARGMSAAIVSLTGSDSHVNVLGISACHFTEHLTGYGRDVFKILAGGWSDILSANEIVIASLVGHYGSGFSGV
ncbi:hypothetical protein GCM10027022_00020 [Alpinimonas psychrophila]